MKILSLLFAILLWFAAPALSFAETKIRVGHFPNITHAQALVAHALSRQGKGWFEQRLGPGTKIEWFIYNAGPSAMEAIFAKSIDLTYVGPGPGASTGHMPPRFEKSADWDANPAMKPYDAGRGSKPN